MKLAVSTSLPMCYFFNTPMDCLVTLVLICGILDDLLYK